MAQKEEAVWVCRECVCAREQKRGTERVLAKQPEPAATTPPEREKHKRFREYNEDTALNGV